MSAEVPTSDCVVPSHLLYGAGPDSLPPNEALPSTEPEMVQGFSIDYGPFTFRAVGAVDELIRDIFDAAKANDYFGVQEPPLDIAVVTEAIVPALPGLGVDYASMKVNPNPSVRIHPTTSRPNRSQGTLFITWGAYTGRNTPPVMRPNPELL